MNAQVRIRADGLHFQAAVKVQKYGPWERYYGMAFSAPFTLSGEAKGYLKGVMACATMPSLAGTSALYVPAVIEAVKDGLRITIGEATFLWKTVAPELFAAVASVRPVDEDECCCEDEDECCQEAEADDYEVEKL